MTRTSSLLMKRHSILPGFALTGSITLFYLSLVVLIPLAGLFLKASTMDWPAFWQAVTAPRVVASYRLTIGASFLAALMNAVFGLLTAWVLVRYSFPGKRLANALVDLPFALPTAVAGITLTTRYAPGGWMGRLLEPFGVKAAFTPLGIMIALTFIGLPFVVRTVQPVLEELDKEVEEAAASLGANRFQTFWRVLLPCVFPALLSGFAMAFARGLGEYGSVVFISGNMPFRTEVTTLLIITKLEQYDYAGAAALGVVMLGLAFFLLLLINLLQWWTGQRRGRSGRGA